MCLLLIQVVAHNYEVYILLAIFMGLDVLNSRHEVWWLLGFKGLGLVLFCMGLTKRWDGLGGVGVYM